MGMPFCGSLSRSRRGVVGGVRHRFTLWDVSVLSIMLRDAMCSLLSEDISEVTKRPWYVTLTTYHG